MTKQTCVVDITKQNIGNIAKYLNEKISACNDDYLFFFFNDVYVNIIDIQDFQGKYMEFMKKYDLPFAFYPYYLHFNKVLTGHIGLKNPKIEIHIGGKPEFNVVDQLVYGSLFIDVKKFKENGITLDERYPMVFFLQVMVKQLVEKGLYLSRMYFMDVLNSYDLMKCNIREGFDFDKKKFMEQKNEYMKENKIQPENINLYVANLKKRYVGEGKVEQADGNQEEQK